MPSFETHCTATKELLGESLEAVHLWLDELAGKPPYGMKHRRVRHHAAGVEEIRKMYGDKAAQAAKLHIEMDLMEEGWTRNDPFPRDEAHYRSMGLF